MLLTAAVAFPSGLWLAGALRTPDVDEAQVARPARSTAASEPLARNPYSADVRGDPYVLAQQHALVEAMERACRQARTGCAEARVARRYIDARVAADR